MSTIPPEVKDVVTFIFVKDQAGRPKANGTGFFVGIRDESNKERGHGYLVTARHVLCDDQGRYYPDILIRLNRIAGGSEILHVPLSGPEGLPVHTHSDRTVDIAAVPLAPRQGVHQFKVLFEELITTRELFDRAKIKEGDEVFFTGLFAPFFGAERNYPIVRFGRVAMLTEERIPWMGEMLNLYLVECQSFGGSSGSPVFFYLGATREPGSIVIGPPTLLLAGVMKGSFLEAREVQVAERATTPVSFENLGIAAVVPAYYLHEILFSGELRKARASSK